jgi:hypothetical protein
MAASRGCMGKLRCLYRDLIAVTILLFLPACGGHKPAGTSQTPAAITLTPATSASMQLGSILSFVASARNGDNQTISPAFTYSLTPESTPGVLQISPTGIACAGSWNAPSYSVCTPGAIGVVQVTASALGGTSPPTTVFVHPAIDTIQISVVPPVNGPPPACPTQVALPATCQVAFNPTTSCLSQNQMQTLQAQAFAQGVDITSTVGPITWGQVNQNVVTITPIVSSSTNVATSQATVVSNIPGATQVVASASGVSSQPYVAETCPVQCIEMEVSQNGTQNPDQISFLTTKGSSQTIAVTAVDVQGCVVPKPPLTWTSSSPAAITAGSVASGCGAGATCTVATTQAGGASITASCTPPTCNVGFPLNNSGLAPLYLPQPVYPVAAISGLVTGVSTATSVIASSKDCYSFSLCPVALYDISTSKNLAGGAIAIPTPPNSMIFDPAGDKAYVGSQYGSLVLTAANIGSSTTSPFTALAAPGTQLGLVTGQVLAVSPNGGLAVFSDTISTPNQVYVTISASAVSSTTTALNINNASLAAFSPDNSKAYILGDAGNTLYVYSQLQALISYPLSAPADAIAFSSTGAFAFLAGGTAGSNISVRNTCDNSLATATGGGNFSITGFQANPLFLKMVPAGNVPTGTTLIPLLNQPTGTALDFFYGVDNTGIDVIATATTTPLTVQQTTSLCPLKTIQLAALQANPTQTFTPLHINLQKGTFHPISFFISPDTTQGYIVTTDQGILDYNFSTQAVTAISLLNDAAPVAADMSADGTLMYVAGSDGMLHQVNLNLAADQPSPIFFSELPNSTNNFCYQNYNCTLDLVAVKP